MEKYDSKKFADAVLDKAIDNNIRCPVCNGNKFTATSYCAQIAVGEHIDCIQLGEGFVPSGILVCTNCGHIDFFALKILGFQFESGDEDEDG